MMKFILSSFLSLFALSAIPAHAQTAAEKEVFALEVAWFKSEQTNTPDAITSMFADDYVATSAEGDVADKAATLADQKSRKFTRSDYEDMKVKAYGDAAVATGGYIGRGTDGEGKPFKEHLRWTDTWIKTSGKWSLVASHYSNIRPKPAKKAP